jgi:hypothetical protein
MASTTTELEVEDTTEMATTTTPAIISTTIADTRIGRTARRRRKTSSTV